LKSEVPAVQRLSTGIEGWRPQVLSLSTSTEIITVPPPAVVFNRLALVLKQGMCKKVHKCERAQTLFLILNYLCGINEAWPIYLRAWEAETSQGLCAQGAPSCPVLDMGRRMCKSSEPSRSWLSRLSSGIPQYYSARLKWWCGVIFSEQCHKCAFAHGEGACCSSIPAACSRR